jgi:hypothetical protein
MLIGVLSILVPRRVAAILGDAAGAIRRRARPVARTVYAFGFWDAQGTLASGLDYLENGA